VLVLATMLSFADGFVLTSLRGAIGAIERTQSPFSAWWHDSALVLPVFVVALAATLALARGRRSTRELSRRGPVLVAGLLLTGVSTLVGVGWVGLTSLRDYRLQTSLLDSRATLSAHLQSAGAHEHGGHLLTLAQAAHDKQATLATHLLGVEQAAVVLLVVNLVLVAWFAALRGGRLHT
jgi:uncharacterized membrane protein